MNWINCKERKPFTEYGESDSVLTVDALGVMRVAYWDGGNWCMPDGEIIETAAKFPITHWKPLPEWPEAEQEIREPEKVYTLSFTVAGTMAQLKALKEYITNSGLTARWSAIRTIGTILPNNHTVKIYIWHNTNGIADQYFVCKDRKVLFRIPKWIGRLFTQRKH